MGNEFRVKGFVSVGSEISDKMNFEFVVHENGRWKNAEGIDKMATGREKQKRKAY